MARLKQILKWPAVLIIYSTTLAFFNAWPAFFLVKSGLFGQESLWFAVSVAISAFFVMFIIPSLLIKFVFEEKLADFGFRLPQSSHEAAKLSGLVILVSLPIIFFLAGQPTFQKYYSITQNVNGFFILFSILTSGLYYFSEEFLFRGFLFFSLWDKLKFHSFWIPSLLFAMLHLTKPSGEIFFAFFFGITASYLSLKTKSFIPAVIVHVILAFTLNFIVNFA